MIEVAIIGGGIAAAAAVIELRERGLSLCVIAPETPGCRDKIGESLSPAATKILKQLGVWEGFCRQGHGESQSAYSVWGLPQVTERNAFGQLEGPGWQIDRRNFEALMWQHAPHHRIPSVVRQFTHDGTGWQIVTRDGDHLEAAFLLDCSGRGSIVGRRFSLRKRADRQLAAYSFLTQKDRGIAPTAGSMVESRPDCWWYSALLPDGRMVITQFYDADLLAGDIHRIESCWRNAVKMAPYTHQRISTAGYEVEGLPVVVDASTTWLKKPAGESWAAAGDAAAALDPLSSHGMTTALWTGRAAALAIDQALSGNSAGLNEYAQEVTAGIENFLRERQKIYGFEQRFREEQFWRRRHLDEWARKSLDFEPPQK